MVGAQKLPLHVCFFDISTWIVPFFLFDQPPGSFYVHTSSKRINKHVRQYFSTSSLIARPENGLLLLSGGLTGNCRCQILLFLTKYSFVYNHFQKMRQLPRGEGKIELTADIHCIMTSGKVACSVHPIVDLLFHRNVWKRGLAGVKMYPSSNTRAFHAYFFLYVKRAIQCYLYFCWTVVACISSVLNIFAYKFP